MILCLGGMGVLAGVGVCVLLAGIFFLASLTQYAWRWITSYAMPGLWCSEQGKEQVSGLRTSTHQAQECTREHDAERTRP